MAVDENERVAVETTGSPMEITVLVLVVEPREDGLCDGTSEVGNCPGVATAPIDDRGKDRAGGVEFDLELAGLSVEMCRDGHGHSAWLSVWACPPRCGACSSSEGGRYVRGGPAARVVSERTDAPLSCPARVFGVRCRRGGSLVRSGCPQEIVRGRGQARCAGLDEFVDPRRRGR